MSAARRLMLSAALAGAAAVLLGAFGAHALRERFDAAQLATWQTATQYLFWHVLAAFSAARYGENRPSRMAVWAAAAFLAGGLIFSASLFALALGAPRGLGAVTPLGGLALVAGWLLLAAAVARR